jgi:hypothetical protein
LLTIFAVNQLKCGVSSEGKITLKVSSSTMEIYSRYNIHWVFRLMEPGRRAVQTEKNTSRPSNARKYGRGCRINLVVVAAIVEKEPGAIRQITVRHPMVVPWRFKMSVKLATLYPLAVGPLCRRPS